MNFTESVARSVEQQSKKIDAEEAKFTGYMSQKVHVRVKLTLPLQLTGRLPKSAETSKTPRRAKRKINLFPNATTGPRRVQNMAQADIHTAMKFTKPINDQNG